MAGNTSSSALPILKEHYSEDNLISMMVADRPFLGMIEKKEDCDGRYMYAPIHVGAGMARSPSYSVARAHAASSGDAYVDFQVPLIMDHGFASISQQLRLMADKKGPGAFLDALKDQPDKQVEAWMDGLSVRIYGSKSGAMGRISSDTTIASSTLKLATALDVFNFQIGMQLTLAAAESSGNERALGSGAHGLYVVGIDELAGTLTIGTTPVIGGTACNITDLTDGIPTAQTGDYIFLRGERNATRAGLKDWLPSTVASDDNFYNVNRSRARSRLAGSYRDGTTGQSVSSLIEYNAAFLGMMGATPDFCMMTPIKMAEFSIELGAKATNVSMQSTQANIGYSGIKVMGPGGKPIVCVGDRHCPADSMFLLTLDSWYLGSVGKIVHIMDADGQTWTRSTDAADLLIQFESFGNLVCRDPRANMRVGL